MTTPHEVDVPETLHAITRRLDDTRDLLEAAVQHLTTLEDRLKRHNAINDLHWDAARILTSDNPDAATTPDGHRTLRAVQDGSDQLVQDLLGRRLHRPHPPSRRRLAAASGPTAHRRARRRRR
jgi:hypothetical protein